MYVSWAWGRRKARQIINWWFDDNEDDLQLCDPAETDFLGLLELIERRWWGREICTYWFEFGVHEVDILQTSDSFCLQAGTIDKLTHRIVKIFYQSSITLFPCEISWSCANCSRIKYPLIEPKTSKKNRFFFKSRWLCSPLWVWTVNILRIYSVFISKIVLNTFQTVVTHERRRRSQQPNTKPHMLRLGHVMSQLKTVMRVTMSC